MDNRVDLQTIKWRKFFMHSGQNRMRSMKIFSLIVSFLCAVSCCFIGQAYASTLDSEGKCIPLQIKGATYTSFFKEGSSRKYGFNIDYRWKEIDGDYRDTGGKLQVDLYGLSKTVAASWNVSDHALAISGTFGDARLSCGYRDPILSFEAPNCNVIKLNLNTDNFCAGTTNMLVSAQKSLVKQALHAMRDAISSSQRKDLIREVLGRSMKPKIYVGGASYTPDSVVPVVTPGKDIVLYVESATDVQVHEDVPVLFWIESELGQPVRDINGNVIPMPLTSKFSKSSTSNSASQVVKNLAVGQYVYFASVDIDSKSQGISQKISFQIDRQLNIKMLSNPPFTSTIPVLVELPSGINSNDKLVFKATWRYVTAGEGRASWPIPFQIIGKSSGYSLSHTITSFRLNILPDWIVPVRDSSPNTTEPGEYKLGVTLIKNGKEGEMVTTNWFKLELLGQPAENDAQQTKSGTLIFETPLILTPAENQVFLSPAKVTVDCIHTVDKKVVTELQYAPFGKEKTDILLFKPLEYMATYQNDDNKIILTFTLKKNGIYRIRARYNDKGSKWTNWHRFKVDTYNKKLLSVVKSNQPKTDFAKTIKKPVERVLPKSPGQQHGVQIAKTKKQNISGVIAKNGINPQPEPPGKQLRSPDLPLQIMPVAHSYRAPAKVKIRVKNTPFSRIPFELGYRPGNGGAYQPVRRPQHTFARTNETTNLTISLKKAGQYRVRFRKNHKAPWTRWLSFQITENPAKTASPAQKIRISPSGARTINPQPEPPGKQVGIQAIRNHGRIQPETQPQLKLSRQPQQPPPAIKTPKNGQKFMLAGKSMHIKAEISHAAGQKIQVEVQYEKGRQFLPVKKGIRIHRMNDKTNVDMVISNTGTYRLKIKNSGKGSQWSKWTTFHVFKVMKNMPHPALKKPEIQPSTVPTIQLPAASLIK